MAPTLSGKVFWKNIQYLASQSAPVLWFYFVLKFTNLTKRCKKALLFSFLVLSGDNEPFRLDKSLTSFVL